MVKHQQTNQGKGLQSGRNETDESWIPYVHRMALVFQAELQNLAR